MTVPSDIADIDFLLTDKHPLAGLRHKAMVKTALFLISQFAFIGVFLWQRFLTLSDPAPAVILIQRQPHWILQVGLGTSVGTVFGWFIGSYVGRIPYETIPKRDRRKEFIGMLILLGCFCLCDIPIDDP